MVLLLPMVPLSSLVLCVNCVFQEVQHVLHKFGYQIDFYVRYQLSCFFLTSNPDRPMGALQPRFFFFVFFLRLLMSDRNRDGRVSYDEVKLFIIHLTNNFSSS